MKNKKLEKRLKEFGQIGLYVMIIVLVLFMFWFFNQMQSNPIYNTYYQYKCDGQIINDSCSTAQIITGGKTYIHNCLSKNEYVCDSAEEIHNG